jgi:hypothetical protein
MIKYQGEDIPFRLDLTPTTDEGSQIQDFSELDNVTMFFYTDVHIAKFSVVEKDGYGVLLVDGMSLSGTIATADTKKMNGALKVDVLCTKVSDTGDLEENMIQAGLPTGIMINTSKIKTEIV